MNRNAINISKCTDIINRLLLHHCPRLNDSYLRISYFIDCISKKMYTLITMVAIHTYGTGY